jgi:hypothetical protein
MLSRAEMEGSEYARRGKKVMARLSGAEGATRKCEEAVGLFEEAAKCSVVARQWAEASRLYEQCAILEATCKGREKESASFFLLAGDAAIHVDTDFALKSYANATTVFIEAGAFQSAAGIEERLGDRYRCVLNTAISKTSKPTYHRHSVHTSTSLTSGL